MFSTYCNSHRKAKGLLFSNVREFVLLVHFILSTIDRYSCVCAGARLLFCFVLFWGVLQHINTVYAI